MNNIGIYTIDGEIKTSANFLDKTVSVFHQDIIKIFHIFNPTLFTLADRV